MAKIPVETVLTARDVNTASTFRSAASAADALHASAGAASSAVRMFSGLAAAAGVAVSVGNLVKINQELEQTQNSLAGNIKVYGYAKNYADSLILADETLRRIRADAASLPGSDSDFIQAFAVTFPTQAELGVKSIELMTKRSNELTAVLLSKGVDARQAGRDLSLMMRGQAGMDVRSFMELKGVMGVKSTEEWNRMSAKKRLAKLDEARGKFGDTIKAFESTWDAVTSTGASYLKNLATEGSKPLFELAKGNIKAINDYIGSIQPKLLDTASLLGTMAADAARFAGRTVAQVGNALMPSRDAMSQTGAAAVSVLNSLATAGSHVLSVLTPVGAALSAAVSAVVSALAPVAAGALQLGEVFYVAGKLFLDASSGILSVLADALGPGLLSVGKLFGGAFSLLADLFIIFVAQLKPYLDATVTVFQWFAQTIGKIVTWIGNKIPGGAGDLVTKGVASFHQVAEDSRAALGVGRVDAAGFLQKYTANFYAEREKAEKARQEALLRIAKDGAKNKWPTINQDFRGSKFDIEQKFAQGFDPGRVLTAVREDAAKVAQRRLQAGITPLFGAGI